LGFIKRFNRFIKFISKKKIIILINYIMYATEEERMKALRASRNKYQKNKE